MADEVIEELQESRNIGTREDFLRQMFRAHMRAVFSHPKAPELPHCGAFVWHLRPLDEGRWIVEGAIRPATEEFVADIVTKTEETEGARVLRNIFDLTDF